MFNIRYLEYFVVSADVGSFSKAGELLYTTQSNISKGIKALENSVGSALFIRQSTGLVLTARGKHVYKYACKILEDVNELKDFSQEEEEETIHFSMNPSSWMADCFVDFYNQIEKENLYWQILTASVKRIMKRVQEAKDELGFVYIMENRQSSFQYALVKNHLEFIPLSTVDVMLYLGKNHPDFSKGKITEESFNQLRFIQSYQDEFTKDNYWSVKDGAGQELEKLHVSVVTNSDYIMERMLLKTELANISSGYLTGNEMQAVEQGISLKEKGNRVIFGYLKRENEELGEWSEKLVNFVQTKLNGMSKDYGKTD